MTTITCKECGAEIPLDEALLHDVKEKALKEIKKDHEQEVKDIESKIRQETTEELKKQVNTEIADLKSQVQEKDKKVDEYKQQELKLRQEKRELEEQKKDIDLEVQRKLDEERAKLQTDVLTKADEKFKFKEAQQQKIINDLKRDLADAQRRAEQGSQQLQGEVLELDLEESLRRAFPNDEIIPIEKGQKGADVKHIIKSPMGATCGVILWESKNTKAWTDTWISKLKVDLRAAKADIPVIISSVLPKGVQAMALYNGVWIATPNLTLALANLLRDKLLAVMREKALSKNRDEKADNLYSYVTSSAFHQQAESIIETYMAMLTEIERERVSFEKIWTVRETQARSILQSTANIIGNMESNVGRGVMPPIKGLELLGSGEDDQL